MGTDCQECGIWGERGEYSKLMLMMVVQVSDYTTNCTPEVVEMMSGFNSTWD